jgi:hypothetical protein
MTACIFVKRIAYNLCYTRTVFSTVTTASLIAMVHATILTSAAAALLLALPASAAGLYPKSSAVLQVDAKNYDRLIAKSNHTSVS